VERPPDWAWARESLDGEGKTSKPRASSRAPALGPGTAVMARLGDGKGMKIENSTRRVNLPVALAEKLAARWE